MDELDISPIPPRPGPELFILRLKGSECHTFTIFSEALWGINVHFVGQRSQPHYKNPDTCPGCKAKNVKRWKGFLNCFDHDMGQEVFLELTPRSAQSLLGQLGVSGSLRGNRIQVKRTGKDNGRLLISTLTACKSVEQLPPGKDPLASLLKLWGLDHLEEFEGLGAGRNGRDFT